MDATTTTVVSAILTALLTTLLVEYFAKPWLDARKERILEDHRRRRDLQRLLVDLAVRRGVIERIEDVWNSAPGKAVDEIQALRDTVARVRDLLATLHNWRIPTDITRFLGHGIGQLDGTLVVLTAVASDHNADPALRHSAVAAVTTIHDELTPAADYVILKGRQHRQPLISRIRTRRAALHAVRTGQLDNYPPASTDTTNTR